jgi:DNA-binding MarR family transcriptional regulator
MSDADDFKDCTGCVCAAIRRAARTVTQHYQRHFRGTGLLGTQFSMLTVLIRGGPMPMGRMAKLLGVERTTLTRNLKPLEKKQWIKIEGEVDGRVRFVSITPKGKAVAKAALPAWRKAQASVAPKIKELRLVELLTRAT